MKPDTYVCDEAKCAWMGMIAGLERNITWHHCPSCGGGLLRRLRTTEEIAASDVNDHQSFMRGASFARDYHDLSDGHQGVGPPGGGPRYLDEPVEHAPGDADIEAAKADAAIEADVAEMKAALERDEIDPESLRTASLDGVSTAALEANGEMLALSGEVDAALLDAAHPDHRSYPELAEDGPFGDCDWGDCSEPAVEWRPATGMPGYRLPVCAQHTAPGLGNREHRGLEHTAETDAALQDSKRRQHEAAKADAAGEAEADPDPGDTIDLEDLA